jgi:hypothetical protein
LKFSELIFCGSTFPWSCFFFFLAILENYDKAQELLEESAEAFQVQFKQR